MTQGSFGASQDNPMFADEAGEQIIGTPDKFGRKIVTGSPAIRVQGSDNLVTEDAFNGVKLIRESFSKM